MRKQRSRNRSDDDGFVEVDVADGGRRRRNVHDIGGDRSGVRRGDAIPIVVGPNGSLRLGGRVGSRAEAIGRKAVKKLDRFLGRVARGSRQAPEDERLDEWGIEDYEDQLGRERRAKRVLSDALRKQVRNNVRLRAANVAYEIGDAPAPAPAAQHRRNEYGRRGTEYGGGDVDADYDADGEDDFFTHPSDEGGDDFGVRGGGRGDGVGRWRQQRPVAPKGWIRTPIADGVEVRTAPGHEVAHMALGGRLHLVAEIPRTVRESTSGNEIGAAMERAARRLLGALGSTPAIGGSGRSEGGGSGDNGPWYKGIPR